MNKYFFISLILITLQVFQSCNSCEKFEHEEYSPELYVENFDSSFRDVIRLYLHKYNETELEKLNHES